VRDADGFTSSPRRVKTERMREELSIQKGVARRLFSSVAAPVLYGCCTRRTCGIVCRLAVIIFCPPCEGC
jgi:hypothetical protein